MCIHWEHTVFRRTVHCLQTHRWSRSSLETLWWMHTYWGVRSAHADPVCHLWAYAEASSCQHCPDRGILICQTSCTALKHSDFIWLNAAAFMEQQAPPNRTKMQQHQLFDHFVHTGVMQSCCVADNYDKYHYLSHSSSALITLFSTSSTASAQLLLFSHYIIIRLLDYSVCSW